MVSITEKFTHQVGGKGFYGAIILEAELRPNQVVVVTFDDKYATEYRAAAQFGIEYAWEQFPERKKAGRGMAAHVVEIGWQPVDTGSVVIAYVAAIAVWKAREWSPLRGITFDEVTGAFIFPKRI